MVVNHWFQFEGPVVESCLELLCKLHPTRADMLQLLADTIEDIVDAGNRAEGGDDDDDVDADGTGAGAGLAALSPECVLAKLNVLGFALKQVRTSARRTPLASFLDSLVLPCIQTLDAEIRNAAVHCLGLYCIADKELARAQLLLLLQVAQVRTLPFFLSTCIRLCVWGGGSLGVVLLHLLFVQICHRLTYLLGDHPCCPVNVCVCVCVSISNCDWFNFGFLFSYLSTRLTRRRCSSQP